MIWIISILLIYGLLVLMGRNDVKKNIYEFSDCFNLLSKMKPTAWSKAKEMMPEERAHCFFLPNVEDTEIIAISRTFVREAMNKNASGPRSDFGQKIGTHKYADSFNEAVNYYHWLLCCTFHLLKNGRLFSITDFDLYTKKFTIGFCPPDIMIKEHSLTMPDNMRCDLDPELFSRIK